LGTRQAIFGRGLSKSALALVAPITGWHNVGGVKAGRAGKKANETRKRIAASLHQVSRSLANVFITNVFNHEYFYK
jgi:hypothetical protein